MSAPDADAAPVTDAADDPAADPAAEQPADPPVEQPAEASPRRVASARGVDLDALATQEEERRFLLASLEDLEKEYAAGDIDEADYTELKDDYTARAAALLRTIESGRAALPAAADRRRPMRAILVVASVLLFGIGAGLLVSRMAGTRASGDTITGDIRDSSTTLLNEAQSLFQSGELLEAIRTFDEVLKTDPGNTEAMAYRGWALFQAGNAGQNVELVDAAEASIDKAIATDANYAPALVFKSVILARYHGDTVGAFETVNQALLVQPPPPPDVRALAEQFRATLAEELGAAAPSTTAGG